jgi:hypothetical protein
MRALAEFYDAHDDPASIARAAGADVVNELLNSGMKIDHWLRRFVDAT